MRLVHLVALGSILGGCGDQVPVAEGRPASSSRDLCTITTRAFDTEGALDWVETWAFDGGGRRTYRLDENSGGLIPYLYDADGHRTELRAWDISGTTPVPGQRELTTYDDGGRESDWWYDQDGDGAVEQIATYTHAVDGSWREQHTDAGADGTVEAIKRERYDDDGRVVRIEVDGGEGGPDGIVDFSEQLEWDDEGRLVTHEKGGEPGVYHFARRWTYDTLGRVVREAMDYDLDGTDEKVTMWDYPRSTDDPILQFQEGEGVAFEAFAVSRVDGWWNVIETRWYDMSGAPGSVVTYEHSCPSERLPLD